MRSCHLGTTHFGLLLNPLVQEMVARRFLETDLSEPARDGHENIVSILDSIICGSDGPSSSDVYGS
jgi:hypothetical protein